MSDAKKGGRPSRKEYKRVRDPKSEEKGKTKENEVRVVASRGQRMYIKYAIDILTGAEGKTKSDSVILSGMGNAVYNVVNVVEILKRRVKGLHQTTEISSQTMTDKYEAVDKEKEGLEVERKVSVIEIVLSTTPLDTNHPGYQEPLPESEVTEQDERADEPRERRPKKKAEPKKEAKKGDAKKGEKKGDKKDGKKETKKDEKKGGRGAAKKDEKKGDKKESGRRGDRRDDRAPARGGRGADRAPARGGRGGRAEGNDRRDDRAPARGGRGGADRRDDRAPARGGRGGRGGNDRADRLADDYDRRRDGAKTAGGKNKQGTKNEVKPKSTRAQ